MFSPIRIAMVLAGAALCLTPPTLSRSAEELSQPGAGNARQPAPEASAIAPSGSTFVNVKATIYQIDLTPPTPFFSRESDLREIAKSEAEFEKALAEFGAVRRMAEIDRPGDLSEVLNVSIGSKVPVVQSVSQTKGGAKATGVSYEDVGVILNLSKCTVDESGKSFSVIVDLEFSSNGESSIDLSADTKAPVFSNWQSKSRMRFDLGAPLVTFEFTDPSADVPASAIVVRYIMTSL